ncbi:MAG: LysE family translocator [Burkholderiaceae bacterium]
MITFVVAVFFLLITPGPGVLSTAGVGSGFGYQAGLRYLIGLFLGTNLVALAVVSGLAAIVLSLPVLRTVLLLASAGYLVYLALRIAMSGANVAFNAAHKAPGIMDGIVVQLLNPKAYVVNTTLFSGFAFWPESLLIENVLKGILINLVWVPIHLLWLAAGVSLHRLELPGRVLFIINLVMAALMLAVVGLAVWSQLATQSP